MMTLHFHPDLIIQSLSEEKIHVSNQEKELLLTDPKPPIVSLFQHLSQGTTEKDLHQHWIRSNEEEIHFYYLLGQLNRGHFLSYRWNRGKKCLLHIVPKRAWTPLYKKIDPPSPIQLSRFAFFRRKGHIWIGESPLSPVELHIYDPKIWMQIFESPASKNLLPILQSAQFLSDADQVPSLATWEFHDLLFHTKSRSGYEKGFFGASFRFKEILAPLPAVKPSNGIALPRPDLNRPGMSFTQVLESRRSIRKHGQTPLSLAQWGEFLFRSARIQKKGHLTPYETTFRPSPGGGACHELELYPLIQESTELEKGLYHYDPDQHTLEYIHPWDEKTEQIKSALERASSFEGTLQSAILIAARFKRVAWKYESIAYATILKNAGALLQTMYLVATSMDLSPCAIGCGNADLFAQIANTDPFEETTVAEFLLGSKKTYSSSH